MSDPFDDYAREQKEIHLAELDANTSIERMAELAGDATIDRDAISDIIRTEASDGHGRRSITEDLPSGKRIWELTKEAIRIEAQAYSQEITMEEVYNGILSRDCECITNELPGNEKRFFETVLDVQCLHRLRDQGGLEVRSVTAKGEFRIAALLALGRGEAVKVARAIIPDIQRERISRIQAGLLQMAALHRECYERANEVVR